MKILSENLLILKDVRELKQPGYYWWLPAMHGDSVEAMAKPENWSIITWHPKDEHRTRSGKALGPLQPPVPSEWETTGRVVAVQEYREYTEGEIPKCPWCGEEQGDAVEDYIPESVAGRDMNSPEYYDCWSCDKWYSITMVDAVTFQVKKHYDD